MLSNFSCTSYPFIFWFCFVLGSNHLIKGLEWGDKELRGQWNLMSSAGPGSPSLQFSSVQFSSVAQLCLTLCSPMDYSTPGFPVRHQLPELAQTHVHRVSDAIQPSHPLSSPSPPAFNFSQHQVFFQRVISSYQVAKILELQLQHQSFQWFPLGLIGLILHPRDSQESSPTRQFKSINSLVLGFLDGPTLTSTHDYWKNHSFD